MLGLLKRIIGAKSLPDELPYEQARAILESQKTGLEQELAGRPDAEPEMLYYLAERGNTPSRRAVAANPTTPAAANRILANDGDGDVRAQLARKIGRLLPELLASERERVCELTLETLRRLAQDQLPRVRVILADEIKTLDCVPKDVVKLLAHDSEEAVAAPILEYSPLLSDNDLLEIVTSARARHVLASVARRKGMSEEVAGAIVSSLDQEAVAALLANPNVRIREEMMDKIITHASKIQPWHTPLAERTDLSLRAIRRIAGFVGASLLEKLCQNKGLDEETALHLKRGLRQRLERDAEAVLTAEDKAKVEAKKAQERGALNEGFVEEAVELGRRELVIECLTSLSGGARPSVEKIFSARSAKAVTAIVWKANLSMRIAFKIQTFILKLPAGELLPARGGINFPMTEDEMRWHLSYFGM